MDNHKTHLYFIHIPAKNNNFKINKNNNYVLIKITKLSLNNEQNINENDYYELSKDLFEFNLIVKNKNIFLSNLKSDTIKKNDYTIDYIFISNETFNLLLKKINTTLIKDLLYKKKNQTYLLTNNILLQGELEKIYNFISIFDNSFSFKTINKKSNKLSYIDIEINKYIHKIFYIKTFTIESIDYYNNNIDNILKYNTIVKIFKFINIDNRFINRNDNNNTINKNTFSNDYVIYNSLNNKYTHYEQNNNKFYFIISNILSKSYQDKILCSYKFEKVTNYKEYIISNTKYYTNKIFLILNIYIKKEILHNIINQKIHKGWIKNYFNFYNKIISQINYTHFTDLINNNENNKILPIKDIEFDYNKLKIKPFNYQKKNMKLMNMIEELVNEKKYYNYLGNIDFLYLNINVIPNNKLIYINNNSDLCSVMNIKDETVLSKFKTKYYINGGILMDEVGLGKTLSSLLLILSKKNENSSYDYNNLIIVPNRLVEQWYMELNNYHVFQTLFLNTTYYVK